MRILIADSDIDSLDVTAYALRREGFQVVTATTGGDALLRWQSDRPHLMLVDAALPQGGGFEVCRRVRLKDDTPVIVLSERSDDEQVIQAFRLGADDFVPKPFSPRQLVVRIKALWRRRGPSDVPEPQRELRAGALLLDVDSHEVHRHEHSVRLTPTEFRLLYILAVNAGRVVSGPRLVEYAWGYDETDVMLLKTHICHIRRKLKLPRGVPGDISAVPGVGYRLTLELHADEGQMGNVPSLPAMVMSNRVPVHVSLPAAA
jgi:DNA-binding response OmpR family regulator